MADLQRYALGTWILPAAVAWCLMPAWLAAQEPLQPPDAAGAADALFRDLPAEAVAGETVVDVRVDGNRDIPLSKIASKISTRAGRPFNPATIQEDIRQLNRTQLFVNVRTEFRKVAGGVVIIFRVVERPKLQYVKYVGNKRVRRSLLVKQVDLKIGQPLDPYTIDEARRKIEEYYHTSGFNSARVTVREGNKPGDRGAVFVIHEGAPQRIGKVVFRGNTIASSARLKTQIESRTPYVAIRPLNFFMFGGFVDREKIDADVARLTDYYRGLGFFDAVVGRDLVFDDEQATATVTFFINEGPRYRVRNVAFAGNEKFRTADLGAEMQLKPGDFFDRTKMQLDRARIEEIYGSYGYIMADINAETRYLGSEQPGVADLVYNVDEGSRYRVGRIDIKITGDNPHTHRRTVLNRLSLQPGDIIDIRELRASERRIRASGLFVDEPARGISPRIKVVPSDEAVDEAVARGEDQGVRGQSPDGAGEDRYVTVTVGDLHAVSQTRPGGGQPSGERKLWQPPPRFAPEPWSGAAAPQRPPVAPWQGSAVTPQRATRRAVPWQAASGKPSVAMTPRAPAPAAGRTAARPSTPTRAAPRSRRPLVVRGQYTPGTGDANPTPQPRPSYPLFQRRPPSDAVDGSYERFPPGYPSDTIPGDASVAPGAVQPTPVDPGIGVPGQGGAETLPSPGDQPVFPQDGFLEFDEPTADLVITPTETQTGRFSIGAGINSDAGVVGNIVLDEQNFSLTRWPRSWGELIDGTGFRGDGQRLRIEAIPGDLVQRYSFSFREPYLFWSPISFGVSGFFYDRRYEDWDEQRVGGNLTLGYQIRYDLTASVTLRAENVDVRNPRVPTPQQVLAVLGDNDVFGARFALAHDTRDNAFLPTEGHLFEIGYEQVFGEFDFPRGSIDARQYFLIRERPDRSGRHVLSLRGSVGMSGTHTPVFENFFAGGFSTLRGFDFRGASPTVLGTAVGGRFMLLGSVEYLMPLTADDAMRMVFFVDYGTVEESVKIESDDFRVAPGIGLRIAVPGLGPAPIALDFAWAVAKEDTDDTQVFSFFVGLLR